MNKKYIKLFVLILGLQMLFQSSVFSQAQATVKLQDPSGTPIAGATVMIGEDGDKVLTSQQGEFEIPAGKESSVRIEAPGYETQIVKLNSTIPVLTLQRMPYQLGEKDIVNVPFGKLKKRQIAGSYDIIDMTAVIRYDEQKSVSGLLSGRTSGLYSSSNLRGAGQPLYVINGIPRQTVDINPHEIEQISVIKDLSAAMLYGSQARNGVILITTRRGEALKKELNFTAESGISTPISYPRYLKAGDYMRLYNEALSNDGLAAKYSQVEIDSTRSGINPVRFPDEDYYNSAYLKDFTSFRNFQGEVIRGNENGKFMLNVGWNHNNGWLAFGAGDNESRDRLNMRSNIDFRVNESIALVFDASVIFNVNKSPRFTGDDFWDYSSTMLPNAFPTLIPADLISDPDMLKAAKIVDNMYVLGGTSEYMNSIYGDLTFNGTRNSSQRLIEMNTGLDFDLGSITQGLTAGAHILFDMYNDFYEDQLNSYAVYTPVYTADLLTSIAKLGADVKVEDRIVSGGDYFRRYGTYGTLNYDRSFGDHLVNGTALAYLDSYTQEGVWQPLKHGHLGLRANYMYKNKYIAELTGVYAKSVKLSSTDNPNSFSPGAGLSWVLSEEEFLSGIKAINFMKLRANWAMLNTDESLTSYNLATDYYTSSGSYAFNDGAGSGGGRRLYPGNSNIGWEKVTSFNAGFEAVLFNSLKLDGSYFNTKNSDIITRRANALPGFFGNLPFENFGSNMVEGVELALGYKKVISGLEMEIGSNLVYSVPTLLTADEIKYPDEYRRTVGKSTDALFGYVAEGLFSNDQDIADHAVQSFGNVKPGDIKYSDLNGDDVVDENDQMMIGNSNPRLSYGVNLRLKFKAFELFALGLGQMGEDNYYNGSYYYIYGNRKYSEAAIGRWTTETAATATHPRLTTLTNSNNDRNSTFWLYENNWFELQTLQLTYTWSSPGIIGLDELRFFARGNNLYKISGIKDKTDLNIGSAPQTRVFSVGLNLMF